MSSFDRRRFLVAGGSLAAATGSVGARPAVGAGSAGDSTGSTDVVPVPNVALAPEPRGMSAANARAAAIAAASPYARRSYARAEALARSVRDPALRDDLVSLVRDPVPAYAARYTTEASRAAIVEAFVREDFVAAGTSVAAFFPPGTDARRATQPFWSAPGSSLDSHHAYPGGLAAHECAVATSALRYGQTCGEIYPALAAKLDPDVAIGAALYHDVMKTVVFQWRDDGTLFPEATIAATGGHHVLSGATALARGRDASFVIALLSAHAAPSLGDEPKVVAWCRAAALLAGIDPIAYGLVRRDGDGYRLAPPVIGIAAFANNLGDHDYTVTIPANRVVRAALAERGVIGWDAANVLARSSAMALYQALALGDARAIDAAISASGRAPSS